MLTNLKKIRLKKNLSQGKLAKLAGVSSSYIANLEKGRKQNPTIEIIDKISKALSVTRDELLGGK